MAAERLSVRKIRELMRLRFAAGLSTRAIARSLGIGTGTVSDYLGRLAVAGLSWPLPPELDNDEALTSRLFPAKEGTGRPEPDWSRIHRELKRKGVTKQLLWQEYLATHPDGYQYSQFCERYLRWGRRTSLVMRQRHRAGEKCFVDFSGDGLEVVDPATGEVRIAKLFVAVLGGSSLTYVEPAFSEDLATWVGCHVRAFEYFGGVSELVVPDNLKAGVTRVHRYEPELNQTYSDLAAHYGFAIIPARPRRPRDKAKVEAAVLVAERWILAVLRDRKFGTLREVSEAVQPLLEVLNGRQMRHLGKSRRDLFEELEREALKPLPSRPFEFFHWKKARVHIDYHVEVEGHWYSVPHTRVGERVDVRFNAGAVEVMSGGVRIASHAKSSARGRYTTLAEHMPTAHREYAEWTPERVTKWAEKVGSACVAFVAALMARRAHPQQGFRAAMGVLRLADSQKYGRERVEKACERALAARAISYRSIESILRCRLDEAKVEERTGSLPETHENLRGPDYFH